MRSFGRSQRKTLARSRPSRYPFFAEAASRDVLDLLGRERAHDVRVLVVDDADPEGDARDLLEPADGGQMRDGRGGHQAARAVAEDVRAIAARDVQHRVERLEHRVGVRVQAPAAMLRARVAPGDREDLLPALDQVLDMAAPRREVRDVELVDHRRYEQDRDRPHLRGRRLVLDELEALVAEHDGSRAQAEVAADGELADVDVGGQARRLAHVPGELPRAAHEVPTARVDRSLEHLGIDERSVGGRQRVDDALGDEAQLAVVGPVELGIVDDPVHRLVHGQVGLQ